MNDLMSCEKLRVAFEAISEDDDPGRMDLRTDPEVVKHLKDCPGCSVWVIYFLRKFIE